MLDQVTYRRLETYVESGECFLDRNFPEWGWSLLDKSEFDIGSARHCALAHLCFTTFKEARALLLLSKDDAEKLGFYINRDRIERECRYDLDQEISYSMRIHEMYRQLTTLWEEKAAKRRARDIFSNNVPEKFKDDIPHFFIAA